jgi:predicted GNAT family acetyltransferase
MTKKLELKLTKRSNNIIKFYFDKYDAHILFQTFENNDPWIAIETFVDEKHRGEGIGHNLFNEVVNYLIEHKIKFKATCPFIVDEANKCDKCKHLYIKD